MNENEKIIEESTAPENNAGQPVVEEKKKRRFTIQSPYADYAADNDMCSQMMGKNEGDVKPDAKQLLKTALSALLTVLFFAGGTLACVSIFSCMGGSI